MNANHQNASRPAYSVNLVHRNSDNSNQTHIASNPFKPPIYKSLTGSHGPMGGNLQNFQKSTSLKHSINSASQMNRKSCPNSRSSILSGGTVNAAGRSSINSQDSCTGQDSRSSSNAFKGDRFIPFRGTQDNFFEEFIINNDPYKEQKKKQKKSSEVQAASQNEQIVHTNNNNNLPTNNNNPDNSTYSSNSSTSSNTQYSHGSGHKKKQSFQELITESLFTNRRGSPNTISSKEAEEEEQRFSKIPDGSKGFTTDQRILLFKEKKIRPSLSLSKNLSLITAIAQEKTQYQQKSLRCIPQFPEKILDAPDLVDDYYLNLLDWSQQNILAVCLAQTVYLWNAESGEIKQLFDTENDADIVTSVSWMKSGSPVLAIGTSSKQVHLWDTNQFSKIRTFDNQHEGRISSLAWNPLYQNLFSSGSLDSLIHNNDIRMPLQQSLLCTYKAHRQEVCGLKWSGDGQQLASGGNDNLLCIWDINNRMRGIPMQNQMYNGPIISGPRYCFTDHKAAVKAISWCPWQKNLLASGGGSRDQCIKFWNTETGQLVNSVQTDSQVCALQWNPFDREILSSHGFINNQLCIWKYPTMKKIADLRGHTSRVLHLSLSPDGTTVASAAADETLRFWKVFQPTQNQQIKNGCGGILNSCMSNSNSDTLMTDCTKLFQSSNSFTNSMMSLR